MPRLYEYQKRAIEFYRRMETAYRRGHEMKVSYALGTWLCTNCGQRLGELGKRCGK